VKFLTLGIKWILFLSLTNASFIGGFLSSFLINILNVLLRFVAEQTLNLSLPSFFRIYIQPPSMAISLETVPRI
jgi:hypothetical protein